MDDISTVEVIQSRKDWMRRADLARSEFDKIDSSQRTNANIWKEVAREYGLSEDLEEFSLRWKLENSENLFDVPQGELNLNMHLSQKEIEKAPRDFFQLMRSWQQFKYSYNRSIKSGEASKLWRVFWGDLDVEKWGDLKLYKRLVRKIITKPEVNKIVQRFGLQDFEMYKNIIKDPLFLEQLRRKQRVLKVLS